MKVYLLTNGINRTAGTERVIVQLAQIFDNVTIIVPGSTKVAFSGYNNLKIISAEIGDFPIKGKLKKIKHRINYFFKLKQIITNTYDTVVISFAFDLNMVNILLSAKLHFRPIICEHIEYNYHNGLRGLIRKNAYCKENVTLVCLTETDKHKFQKDGINAVTIPNFIHRIESRYEASSKKIISIGRLEYQKNFLFLVDAFSKSKLYEQGWTLSIIGEGAEYAEIKAKIELYKMNEFITIHEFTKDIGKYYNEAAVMCMTSRFEAFPMVLLEALNHGLPVVVTDFPTGAQEILGENNFQIVKEYNPDIFAKALLILCENEELRKKLSQENLDLIQKYYPDQIIRSWHNLLEDNCN